MPKCLTCGLLWHEPLFPWLERHDELSRETLSFLQTVDPSAHDFVPIAIYCAIQAEEFKTQVDTPALEVTDASHVLHVEHNCPYFAQKHPSVPRERYWLHYERLKAAQQMNTITITNSTLVGAAVGGSNNTVNAYVAGLAIERSSTPEERTLKESLASLRQEIDSADLSRANRVAAISDLEAFTRELAQPPSEERQSALGVFWSRLKDAVSLSSSASTLAINIAKMLGLVS